MRNNMRKMTVLLPLASLAALTLGCITLLAADSEDHGVIAFPGNPSWAWAMRPSATTTLANIPNVTNLYTIYSNLGSKTHAYNDQTGYKVHGPDSGEGHEEWIAMPFTPNSNALVTTIEVAVQYNKAGTNAVTISLNEDAAGLPGKAVHTWNLTNLPKFGTCCKLDVVKNSRGLKVMRSVQYWVVASTNANAQRTEDVWDFTYNGATGQFAFNQGSGWQSQNSYLSAFGVFGKKTK